MLSPTAATIRLFIHVLAATIWVGGQFVLAGVVPTLRAEAPEVTRSVARAFARLAWPAFGILVVTGIWNLVEIDIANTDTTYQITVFVKVTVAILSGVFVAVHSLGSSTMAKAIGGGLGALFSVAAVFLGLLLQTGT